MAKSAVSGSIVIGAADLFSNSAIQEHHLGELASVSDGRMARYCKAGGTALAAGKLQQSAASIADHQNIAVAAAAAAGATTVTVTLGATAVTENYYAGGTLVVNDATGEGYTYRIASHPAAALSASLVITLDDPIVVALTTSSEVCLTANPYSGVIIHPTTPTGIAVGVPLTAITAGQYGWLVTKGVVSCLADGSAAAIGAAISPSNGTAGAVESGVIGQGVVGQTVIAGVDTEYRPVFLNLP